MNTYIYVQMGLSALLVLTSLGLELKIVRELNLADPVTGLFDAALELGDAERGRVGYQLHVDQPAVAVEEQRAGIDVVLPHQQVGRTADLTT